MALSCGIVGLPNVGKSTLFNALTANSIPAENYPFCTIEPNVGIVPVPDERLGRLAHAHKSAKVTPATVQFVDIAGLVEGASRGEGLGNQFLAHIREVSAIVHVVRCFEAPNVVHVSGSIDPVRDIAIINTELLLKDLETVQRRKDTLAKKKRSGDDVVQELSILMCLEENLNRGVPARCIPFDDDQAIRFVRELCLLTDKPVLYVANTDEEGFVHGNMYTAQVSEVAQREGANSLILCSKIEAEIMQLLPEEKAYFLQELGIEKPALERLIQQAYSFLGLITFFTAGSKETRAWTIQRGTTAPEAAGVIHSDFERGFIRAEVMRYTDWERLGSEQAVREAGLYRIEGRDYIVEDGDIIFFRFNV